MRVPDKWVALATANLVVMACLCVGVGVIASRLGNRVQVVKERVSTLPTNPPTDMEVARLNLLSTRIKVMQDNLANAETVAFKRQRVYVEGGNPPRVASDQLDLSQGSLESTTCNTDLAISGDGFFHVKVIPTVADGTAYTRNGMLRRNPNGELVVSVGNGCSLIPPLTLPPDATHVAVDQDGTVSYSTPASVRRTVAGQITLCRFTNPQALNRQAGSLYTETTDSGRAIVDTPGNNGMGTVLQGYLEASNVDPLKEWAALLRAERMLQFSSQASANDPG